jgi:RNA 2',3'-cyclic 3'-phosphodiesterase
MRLFAAILPSDAACEHLEDFLEVRREAAPLRWTDAEQFHITLAFCEDFPDHRVEDLVATCEEVAGAQKSFRLRLAGGGALPNVAEARVLYVAIKEETLGQLKSLAVVTRNALNRTGGRTSSERFLPHLTVGRTGRPTEFSNWVRLLDAYSGPSWLATEFVLVASYLGQGRRRRPRYEIVSSHTLQPEIS